MSKWSRFLVVSKLIFAPRRAFLAAHPQTELIPMISFCLLFKHFLGRRQCVNPESWQRLVPDRLDMNKFLERKVQILIIDLLLYAWRLFNTKTQYLVTRIYKINFCWKINKNMVLKLLYIKIEGQSFKGSGIIRKRMILSLNWLMRNLYYQWFSFTYSYFLI